MEGEERHGAQTQFAEFLEDRISEIAEPAGATLAEVVKSLSINRKVEWAKAVNLANGNIQFTYSETDDAKAGQNGKLTVPTEFTLKMPVLKYGADRVITAKLRYRLEEGKLLFLFKINDLEQMLDQVFLDFLAEVEKVTGIKPFLGCP